MPEDDLSNKIINNTANRIRRHMNDEAAEFYIDGELSDETKARYEAAFKADEDKPKFVGTPKGDNILKDILDGKIPKPPSLEDMLREQLDAGGILDESPEPDDNADIKEAEQFMDHVHELFENHKDGIQKVIEDLGADKPWGLTKDEEKELINLLAPVGEFLYKHELPGMIHIQTARVNGSEGRMISFKTLPLLKVCPHLGLLIKAGNVLLSNKLRKEEYEALMDLVFQISMAQRLRGE